MVQKTDFFAEIINSKKEITQNSWIKTDPDIPGDKENPSGLLKDVEKQIIALLMGGSYTQCMEFIDSLPVHVFTNLPSLLVYKATAMLFSEFPRQSILEVLSEAENCPRSDTIEGPITAILALLESYTGDPETGIRLSSKALLLIERQNLFFKNLMEHNLGVAYTLKNDLQNANLWFEKLLLSSIQLQDFSGILASYYYITHIRKVQGRFYDASVIYKKALEFIQDNNLDYLPHAIKIRTGYGHLLLQWHRIDEAKYYLNKAIQLAKQTDILYAHTAYQYLSEAFIRENDFNNALAVIHECHQNKLGIGDLYEHIHHQHFLAMEARIQLETGGIEQAYDWLLAMGYDQLSADDLRSNFREQMGFFIPIAARIFIAKGMPEKAILLLEAVIPKFIQQGANSYLIRSLNAQAAAYCAIGEPDKAIVNVIKAVKLGQCEKNLGDFIFIGRQLMPVLYEIMYSGLATEYCSHLLSILSSMQPENISKSQGINPLSPREMDVLALIARGLTNQEVAKVLFLSTNTIKSHSIKIYRKLQVNNRNQAVSKARLLGILPNNLATTLRN